MNLLIFDRDNLTAEGELRLAGDIARHAHKILKVQPGDRLSVGALEGRIGHATVRSSTPGELHLASPELTEDPPAELPVELLLALPRPKFLGRVLQDVTAFGVKRIRLLQTARVEKSYWSSSLLAPAAIERCLRLGLQQGRDTVRPEVSFYRRWQEVLDLVQDGDAPLWVADGSGESLLEPKPGTEGALLLIGPEGGLVPPELEQLRALGARFGHLGARILRVETAVAAALSRCL